MPSLRRLSIFRKPQIWLGIVCAAILLTTLDAMRSPPSQLTGHAYVAAVDAYQRWGRPLTSGWIRCRYQPTCSEYSREAVEKFGIARGLTMTVRRLARCRSSVPQGTPDPVP